MFQQLQQIKPTIGKFAFYKCVNPQPQQPPIEGENIPLYLKPGQQLKQAALWAYQNPQNTTVIKDFTGGNGQFAIPNHKIRDTCNSSSIYLNTTVLSRQTYNQVLNSQLQLKEDPRDVNSNWLKNHSTAIYHTQQTYLMVEQYIFNGQAYNQPRTGNMDLNECPLTLISVPSVDFTKAGADLNPQEAQWLLEEMYTGLFKVAAKSGTFIAMPPGGLGAFLGDTKSLEPNEKERIQQRINMHFTALAKAAKKFPNLNIVYNPGQFAGIFQQWQMPPNIYPVYGEDIVFLAKALNEAGWQGSIWNPSDPYGVYGDLGMFWENGTGIRFVAEEYNIALATSGVLGRKDVNPNGWPKNVIELAPSLHPVLNLNQSLQQNQMQNSQQVSNSQMMNQSMQQPTQISLQSQPPQNMPQNPPSQMQIPQNQISNQLPIFPPNMPQNPPHFPPQSPQKQSMMFLSSQYPQQQVPSNQAFGNQPFGTPSPYFPSLNSSPYQPNFFQPGPSVPELKGAGYLNIPRNQEEINKYILTCVQITTGNTTGLGSAVEKIESAGTQFPPGTFFVKCEDKGTAEQAVKYLSSDGFGANYDKTHPYYFTVTIPPEYYSALYWCALKAWNEDRKNTSKTTNLLSSSIAFFSASPKIKIIETAMRFLQNGAQSGEGLDVSELKALGPYFRSPGK